MSDFLVVNGLKVVIWSDLSFKHSLVECFQFLNVLIVFLRVLEVLSTSALVVSLPVTVVHSCLVQIIFHHVVER